MITGERSAILTILLTLFFIFFQYKINFRLKLIFVSFFFALSFLMITLNPHVKARYITYFGNDMEKNDHLSIFEKIATTPWGLHAQKSVKIFFDKPLNGHGLKSFRVKCDQLALDPPSRPYFQLFVVRDEKIHRACSTHPHNLVLEILTEQGIIGFIFFFSFFILLFKRSIVKNGFFSRDLSIIGLRSLIFVLIFVPKPVGSIFTSVNATMIWFYASLFVYQIYSKKINEN